MNSRFRFLGTFFLQRHQFLPSQIIDARVGKAPVPQVPERIDRLRNRREELLFIVV